MSVGLLLLRVLAFFAWTGTTLPSLALMLDFYVR
jgi:hypothetical protein